MLLILTKIDNYLTKIFVNNFFYRHKSSNFELLILILMIQQAETKIKQIRELKNFTQEYMAQKLGLSTRAYSKIETGETQLTINRLNEISAIMGVPPMEVLGFDDKQVFNNCKQDGYIGINHINLPEKLIQQYEETIQSLKEQIQLMKLLQDK